MYNPYLWMQLLLIHTHSEVHTDKSLDMLGLLCTHGWGEPFTHSLLCWEPERSLGVSHQPPATDLRVAFEKCSGTQKPVGHFNIFEEVEKRQNTLLPPQTLPVEGVLSPSTRAVIRRHPADQLAVSLIRYRARSSGTTGTQTFTFTSVLCFTLCAPTALLIHRQPTGLYTRIPNWITRVKIKYVVGKNSKSIRNVYAHIAYRKQYWKQPISG